MAVFNFLAVCCRSALTKVAGLNKSPSTNGSDNKLPLADCVRHFIKEIRFRTNSRNHACGLSGPPSHRPVQSAGTSDDNKAVAADCITGVNKPEPNNTFFNAPSAPSTLVHRSPARSLSIPTKSSTGSLPPPVGLGQVKVRVRVRDMVELR